ncbi:MAG: hypothetical protein ABIS86_24375, partial [Streptosporangiaceae bacterium]
MTPRRFRRLGRTSMALSAGTLVLVFGTALPAGAEGVSPTRTTTVKPKKCAKGIDPQSTIDNIVCQVKNTVDDIKQKIDENNKPRTVAPKEKPADKKKKPVKEKKPAKRPPQRTLPVQAPAAPDSTVPLYRPESLQKVTGVPQQVSGILPAQPQVAPLQDTPEVLAAPETHLISPVASITPTGDDTALWVAGASGLAAGVVMLQFSLL